MKKILKAQHLFKALLPIKPTKSNLQNQTQKINETKPSKQYLPNQTTKQIQLNHTYQTKITKLNLTNQT